jgi:hypothetical protein
MTDLDVSYDAAERELQQELDRIRAERQAGAVEVDPSLVAAPGETWELNTTGGRAKPYRFMLDGEEMLAASVMPAGYTIDMLDNRADLSSKDRKKQFDIIMSMLGAILYPESMELLRDRMRDPKHPVEIGDVTTILNHLSTVVYGRPTRQSSASQDAPATTGTTSTDGASPAESTTGPSPTTPVPSTSSMPGSSTDTTPSSELL